VAQVVKTLEEHGAMEYTVIVAATASDPAPMQYIAPYSGCAIGEFFRDTKRHALCIYDDLSKHAAAYRRDFPAAAPPARPRSLSRRRVLPAQPSAGARLEALGRPGGGSLTALPFIETQAGDVSAYIPTNVISITDGQIYLEADLFNSNIRPAINAGLSVSRVGGSARSKAMRQVAGTLRLELAQYRDLAAFAQFGSELDKSSMAQLNRGKRLIEILKQPQYQPLPVEKQILILFAGANAYLDDLAVEDCRPFEDSMYQFVDNAHPGLLVKIREQKKIEDALRAEIHAVVKEAKERFLSERRADACLL